MNLYDKLPAEDKQLIKDYLVEYTNVDAIPNLELTLREWAKNKKTMYRALGNNFRVKIPVTPKYIDKDMVLTVAQNKYYYPPNLFCRFWVKDAYITHIYEKDNLHPFIKSVGAYLSKIENDLRRYNFQDLIAGLHEMFCYKTIFENNLYGVFGIGKYFYKDKCLQLTKEMKPMKAIRKILEFLGYDDMPMFEKYREDMSLITTSNITSEVNFVFSIHPIDFFTMSHNKSHWSSCMNWDGGAYSNGVLEMLNSNMTVVAYVESRDEKFKVNGRVIPNKTWRSLYYVHKKILCSGKAYPYNSEMLTKFGLDKLAEMVQENLNWTYQYKNQEYHDMKNFYNNTDARAFEPKYSAYSDKHNIILYNYAAMYNDLIEDKGCVYWCYRNWVPKTLKLCVSGVATCILCGEPLTPVKTMHTERDEDCYCRGSNRFCANCRGKYYINSKVGYIIDESSLYRLNNQYTYSYLYDKWGAVRENLKYVTNPYSNAITRKAFLKHYYIVEKPECLKIEANTPIVFGKQDTYNLKYYLIHKTNYSFDKLFREVTEEDFEKLFNCGAISLY